MSRQRQDPVDAAFERWADLTPEQKKHFSWAMEGYNSARREAIRDNGGVEPERVAPRTRQRKPRVDVHAGAYQSAGVGERTKPKVDDTIEKAPDIKDSLDAALKAGRRPGVF